MFFIKNDPYPDAGTYSTYAPNYFKVIGYADPSIRKQPNSDTTFLAYAVPTAFASNNGSFNAIHLAHSTDGGMTFTLDGAVLNPVPSTQTQSTAYGSSNESSHNTPDILPIAQAWQHTLGSGAPGNLGSRLCVCRN